jgi:hypothetical protein
MKIIINESQLRQIIESKKNIRAYKLMVDELGLKNASEQLGIPVYKLIEMGAVEKSLFQNTLNETLKMLKDAAEEEPRDFRPIFSENIDNVESIDIESFDNEEIRNNIKLIINVVVTLDVDIPFGKWEAIAEIFDELQYYMKRKLMTYIKLKLADNGVKILNNIERDI